MKITGVKNTTITDIAPKVIETAHGFLLNTQYYTKEKMSPVPFEVCDLYGSPYSLCTRKVLYLQRYSWNDPNDEIGILRDSIYPNRYYLRTLTGYISGAKESRLITFEETEHGEINILNEYNMGDYQFLEYVGQDNDYMYWTQRSNTTLSLYCIDKATHDVSRMWYTSYSWNYARLRKIHEDDTNIYFMYMGDQNIYALTFSKVTHGLTGSQAIYRGQETTTDNYYLTNLSDDPYKIDDNTYGLFLCNIANPEQPIDFYQYNTKDTFENGFKMQKTTITWNNQKSKIDFFETVVAYNNSQYSTVRNFISEFNGIKYLNVAVYQIYYENANFIPTQGIYTFRINSETSLTFTGYNQVDGAKQFSSFIYDESREHLLVGKQNAFQILKFNQTTLRYESTNFEITGCYCVGLDELQRVWYLKQDSSVHMVNLEDAQSVEIDFEKNCYDYTGTVINTYINFSALNYLGERFSGIFELTISGPAIFTENNNSTLRFTYSGVGKQQIGIAITGASPITIYPKFIS
jgi:hypothetical protein